MHPLRRPTWSSATTRRRLCAVACCILAAAALALAGLTAAAAPVAAAVPKTTAQQQHQPPPPTPQPHLSPQPHSLSSLPPPLPVFEGGQWSGARVMVPASECAHSNPISLLQDARPGHELDWIITCDSDNPSLSVLGRWSRLMHQFTPLLRGVLPIRSLDQSADSSLLTVVMADPLESSGFRHVYTMDIDQGQSSLKRIINGSVHCDITQAMSSGEELLFLCGDQGRDLGPLQSVWMDDLQSPRVLLRKAAAPAGPIPQMQRVGSFVTLVAGFAQIYTYPLNAGRATLPQQVFNQSQALCTGGAPQAFAAGPNERVFAMCYKYAERASIAIWDPKTRDYSEESLLLCQPTSSVYDHRTDSLLIACQESNSLTWLWLYSDGVLTQLMATRAPYTGVIAFDNGDLRSVVYASYTQRPDSSWATAISSMSGDGSLSFGNVCPDMCQLAIDEERSVTWIGCCSGTSDMPLLLRMDGFPPTRILLADVCIGRDTLVPQGSLQGYELLVLCWTQTGEGSFLMGVRGLTARTIVSNLNTQYALLFWDPASQALFASSFASPGVPSLVDRIDLASGTAVRLISGSNEDNEYVAAYGFFDKHFYLSVEDDEVMRILRIPADTRAAVNGTLVVPLSANCSDVRAVEFDAGANTLWVACATRFLVWNLTSGAPSLSVRPPTYPPLTASGSFGFFGRDSATGLILYGFDAEEVLVALMDPSGAIYRASSCFDPSTVALDRRTSTFWLLCQTGDLVALTTAFACAAGSGWNNGACQPCASGSAHAVVPFDPQLRRVAQCEVCASGWVAPVSGSAQCTPCPVGQFLADPMNQVCSPCQPGYSQNETGTTFCNQCGPGSFSSDIQAANCTLAPPGSFVQANHSSSATLCSRGSATAEWGRTDPCTPCKTGFESPQFGGTECTACKLGSSAATGGFCSPCPVATYTPSAGSACVLCTDADQAGLACNGFASVKEGWWAYAEFDAAQNASVFRTTPCPFGFCPGSALQQTAAHPNAPQLCTSPRLSSADNWLCAECESGYVPWGDHCDSCTAPNAPLIFAALVACFVIVAYILAGVGSAGQVGVLLYFVQIAALELPPSLDWLRWLRLSNLGASSLHSCLAPLTPLEQFGLTFATPLILCVVLAAVMSVHSILIRCVVQLQSSLTRSRYLNALLGIFLFSYTAVSLAVMESLHCVSVAPGVRRLYAAPTVDCDSDEYRRFLPLAVVVLCAFLVGLPVALLVVLWRRRTEEQRWGRAKAEAASPLAAGAGPDVTPSVFHLGYTDSAWFWSPLILLRRFLFAILAVLLSQSPNTRNVSFAMLHFAFLLLHLWATPFESDELNRVERGSYVLLFVLSCCLAMLSAPCSVAVQLLLFALCVPAAAGLLWWTLKHKLAGCLGRSQEADSDAHSSSTETIAPYSELRAAAAPLRQLAVAGVSEHSFASYGSHSRSINEDSASRADLQRQLLSDAHKI